MTVNLLSQKLLCLMQKNVQQKLVHIWRPIKIGKAYGEIGKLRSAAEIDAINIHLHPQKNSNTR